MSEDGKVKKSLSSKTLGFIWLLVIFGILFTILGIISLTSTNSYDAPVYISQRLTVTENSSSITVTGEIKNLTSENIFIDEINIHLSGYAGYNTTNYANEKITDISIAPNETYEIRETYPYKYSDLNNASISYITIDSNKYVDIKYSSNGSDFEGQDSPSVIQIISLPVGIIMLVSAIIVYFVARKPEEAHSALLKDDTNKNNVINDIYDKNDFYDDYQNKNTEIYEIDNESTQNNIVIDIDDTKQYADKMIDQYAIPMTNKTKMERLSKMFNQPFTQVMGEQSISICNYKSKIYSFRPNTKPNSFAYLIEIPFGKTTRYFASEYSHGFTFILTEWVFDKDNKLAHINYENITENANEIVHHKEQFIKKVRQIIKNETKD